MTDIAKRQYVLSLHPLLMKDMQEHRFAGMYLYIHRELNMNIWHTADGAEVVVLGNAFCTDKAGKQPEMDIAEFSGEDVLSATRYWTGRWTLLTENELFTDAAGLMGAYYDEKAWVVSSSPALLARVTGKQSRGTVKETGISWIIVPESVIDGAKTLLCTQRLLLGEKLQVAAKNWITDCTAMSTDEKCEAVADMLVNAVKNLHSFSGKELLLALTGGKDSRVTFSALVKAGVPFSCYTAQHENISSADISIPKKLCAANKIPHTYIKSGKTDKARLWDYIRFTAGNSNGADAQFFARGQFDKLPDNAIVIRSGLYEAGQTYGRSIAGADMDSFTEGMVRYYSELKTDPMQKEAFSQWLKNAQENPIAFVDIRDRFYIEQRVGGWAAAIEQSLDMNDFTSIQIANCAALLSIFLSANETERKNLALAYGSVQLLEPELMNYDVNKAALSDKLRFARAVLKNPIKKLRAFLSRKNRR